MPGRSREAFSPSSNKKGKRELSFFEFNCLSYGRAGQVALPANVIFKPATFGLGSTLTTRPV